MFPEISAQWSLLEPTFRYLLSDREGEKCWSLNHAWQIPFFHSAQFIISSNFYIYGTLVPSSIVSALKEKQWRWAKTFCHLWKPSHFPNMKCFLQPFFAQNKPEMISESINQLRLLGSQKEQNLHNIIKQQIYSISCRYHEWSKKILYSFFHITRNFYTWAPGKLLWNRLYDELNSFLLAA